MRNEEKFRQMAGGRNFLIMSHFVLMLYLSYKKPLGLYKIIVILLTPWCFTCLLFHRRLTVVSLFFRV